MSRNPYSENMLQAYVASALRRMIDGGAPMEFAADQNGAYQSKVKAAQAKAAGMVAGEPDLRIYLPGGVCRQIEMKAKNGHRSKAQKERHTRLAALGHTIATVKATTPLAAVTAVVTLVAGWLAEFGYPLSAQQVSKIINTGLPRAGSAAKAKTNQNARQRAASVGSIPGTPFN